MPELSTLAEDYLKAIWNAGEWSVRPVTVGVLAARLGLAPSSVSEGVRKLTDRGLVTHEKYGSIRLTREGEQAALSMVRKHRLIETFLVDYLGYRWDEIHDEAEALEHAVTDEFIDRLAARLGNPTRDPHGDPIPLGTGALPPEAEIPLGEVAPGSRVAIRRVSDADPELLRHLQDTGLTRDVLIGVVRHIRGGNHRGPVGRRDHPSRRESSGCHPRGPA